MASPSRSISADSTAAPNASPSGARACADVIADEPTGNLDEATGAAIIELLFAARARSGSTLVLVTHDSALAARCDRTLRMRSGRLEADAPAPVEA